MSYVLNELPDYYIHEYIKKFITITIEKLGLDGVADLKTIIKEDRAVETERRASSQPTSSGDKSLNTKNWILYSSNNTSNIKLGLQKKDCKSSYNYCGKSGFKYADCKMCLHANRYSQSTARLQPNGCNGIWITVIDSALWLAVFVAVEKLLWL